MRMIYSWAAVLLVGIVVQKVILSNFSGISPRPDLMLLVVVSAGLLAGKEAGVGIGFFAGLMQDLSSGNVFGLNIFPKMAAGYLAGLMESKVFKENIFLPAAMSVVATFLNGVIVFVFLYIVGYWTDFWSFAIYQFLPMAVCNLIIAIPAHQVVYRVIYKCKTQKGGIF